FSTSLVKHPLFDMPPLQGSCDEYFFIDGRCPSLTYYALSGLSFFQKLVQDDKNHPCHVILNEVKNPTFQLEES
ncbi:MAG: hypothetical protein MUP24_09590, partial [Gillisia sp.]|nr:hypothetical protein [Gillisia sp.]